MDFEEKQTATRFVRLVKGRRNVNCVLHALTSKNGPCRVHIPQPTGMVKE